jgi:outer membrane biosynthesis protein TonB
MRLGLTAALPIAAALLLMGCGSSGKGLISAAAAGPLKSDIEAVDLAAQEGNGNCTATEAALQRTEQDFAALPASTDSGLHNTLRTGVANLRKVASELCRQPLVNTTTTPSTSTTTPTTTKTTPPAEEEEKEKAKATEEEKAKEETEQTPGGPGGGTPAPGEGAGQGAGGAVPEEGTGNGAGGQESGK